MPATGFALFFSALLPLKSYGADCEPKTTSTTVSFSNVSVTPDIAVGESFTGDKEFNSVTFASCEASMTFSKDFDVELHAVLTPVGVYNGRETYSTNIPGVGVQFGADMTQDEKDGGTTTSKKWIPSGTELTFFQIWNIGWGDVFTYSMAPMLSLIKTSSTVSSGTLSGEVGYAEADGNQRSTKTTVNFNGTVSSSGCSISGGQDLSITLSDVYPADLPSVGSTWGQSGEKDITLNCNAGTNVYIKFDGTQSSESTSDTVLQNNGTAKGVGVQLMDLHDGQTNKAIDMGYRWSPVSNSGTSAKIPIAARYYRTGTLSAGTVDASATYTLDYD